jgi:hypothetical protein
VTDKGPSDSLFKQHRDISEYLISRAVRKDKGTVPFMRSMFVKLFYLCMLNKGETSKQTFLKS